MISLRFHVQHRGRKTKVAPIDENHRGLFIGCMAGMKRNRIFRGFPVLFRMRWGRAGRGRPGGDRRPGRGEEAFRQSRARRDEGRGGPVRLPWRRRGRHRWDGRAGGEDGAGVAGRVVGHQDVLGPDRPRGEPGRGGTHPRTEGRTQGRPGPAALPVGCSRRVLGRPGDT